VGDIDHRGQAAGAAWRFRAHVDAQGGVEIAQGSSKRKAFGLAHDGAADGDALALAAGELGAAVAIEQVFHLRMRAASTFWSRSVPWAPWPI
jgi:hypothetical protein